MVETAAAKTLIIGLDVGDGHLIQQWSAAGYLPTLRALIAEGTWGWIKTTAQQLHVSAWPSLYTGTSPGEHGVYYTFQPVPGQQGYRKFSANQYGRPTFWHMLSEAGIRCTVFDAPYTHPEPNFRGVQLFEWGTWAHYWQRMSTPPAILRRLQKACGSYPLGMEANDMGLSYIDPADMQRRLVVSTAAKAQAAAWLLAETPWDLSFVVFGETHPAAHYCWSAATEHVGNGSIGRNMLRPVYEAVDQGIATILASVGRDTTVFVVSGDGVGPNHSGWHLLPGVLQRLGFLVSSDPASGEAAKQHNDTNGTGQGKRDPIKALRNLLPKDLRKQVARHLPTRLREALARRVDLGGIDWSQTRAYCLPTDLEGCIRINLQGREPAGIVREGAEYRAVCDELTAALEELVDPDTGRPAVRQVIHTDDVFPGRRRAYLPDLIVLWTEDSQLTQLASPKIGTVANVSPDARPGTHTPTAFVLVHGPSIDPGTTIDSGHVLDFAPTLLSRFAMRLPDHLEGRPWHTLLTR